MKEINPSEKILDLLSTKKYTSLTEEEILLVLNEMDKEDYERMFELHHQLNSTFRENTVSPNEKLKTELLTAFEIHHATRGNKKSVLRFLYVKIPLYQPIAAAIMIFIFLTALYFLNDFSAIKNEQIVYKYLTDTLYLQPEIVKHQDTLKINTDSENKNVTKLKINQPHHPVKAEESIPSTLCRSIKSDSTLKQFMVSL